MSFSAVKNVRITSLTPGAVVELRFGKTAIKSDEDVHTTATFVRHETVPLPSNAGDMHVAVFNETDADGNASELSISRLPTAPWRSGQQYVSLLGVDEATFTIAKPASAIQTDVIGEAISLITKEADDVYASQQLIALLEHIKGGKRVGADLKAKANQFSTKMVEELSSLPDKS